MTKKSISKVKDIPVEIVFDDPEKLERGYIAKALVVASLPHSEKEDLVYERRNGNYVLRIKADPRYGMPHGVYPRKLLVWMTTEAVRTKSRVLNAGKNQAEFLRMLGIPRNGPRIKDLRNQMKRLFSASISFECSTKNSDIGLNMYPVEKYELYWGKNLDESSMWESTITLSEAFFNELMKSPVVFFLEALKSLGKSLMGIDIYLWATYKNSYTTAPTMIKWEDIQAQFGADYPRDARGRANFKSKFKAALKKVQAIYPEARSISVQDKGVLFVPGEPHVPKTKELPSKGQK